MIAENTPGRFPDNGLTDKVNLREEGIFEKFLNAYGWIFYTQCSNSSRTKEETEDRYQEVLKKIWEKTDQYDSSRPFLPWSKTVCKNLIRDLMRREKTRKKVNRMESINFDREEIKQSRLPFEEKSEIKRYVKKLPGKQKEIIEMVYLRENTLTETANKLNIPIGTVKSRLNNGLTRLRNAISGNHDFDEYR